MKFNNLDTEQKFDSNVEIKSPDFDIYARFGLDLDYLKFLWSNF